MTTPDVVPLGGSPAGDAAIAALHRHFDKIFVLTLARAVERHAHVKRVLAGVDHELVFGVDKLDLDERELVRTGAYDPARARALHRYGRPMRIGHVACSMSHLEIYRRVLAGGWRRVLIFEDDVVPVPAALPFVGPALDQLPDSWELVYLGYDRNERVGARERRKQAFYRVLSALRLVKWTPTEVANLYPRPYSANLVRAGHHDCTHAYAITPSAARKMIAAQSPVVTNVDSALTRVILRGELEAYACVPVLFSQVGGTGRARSGARYIEDELPRPGRATAS